MTVTKLSSRLAAIFLSILAIIGIVLICVNTNAAFAEQNKIIALDANGGTAPQSIKLTEEGTLPELPSAEKEGWTFEGWYTASISERVSFDTPTDPNTYWRWNITTEGDKVEAGQSVETTTLYAKYTPTNISFNIYPAGWMGITGVMSSGREYGVPFSGIVYGWLKDDTVPQEDGDYVFDGWYDAQIGGNKITTVGDIKEGTQFDHLTPDWTPLTGQDLWMHWHLKSNPEVTQETYEKFEYTDATGLIAGINESGLKCTSRVTASATIYPEGQTNVKTLEWSVDKPELIKIIGTGLSVTLQAQGNAGVATVTAKIPDTEYTSTFHVNVYHNMNSGRVIKSGGCTDPETVQYKCKDCSYSETKEFPAPGHRFVTHEYYASCTEPGHTTRVCRVCGYHDDVQTQAALGHHYTVKEIKSCGGLEVQRTCTTCGVTETDTDESQVNHNWATTATIDKPATCKSEGSKSIHCLDCDVTKDVTTIPIDESKHSFTSWTITREPTAFVVGERERHCTICGDTETEEIARLQNDIPYVEPEDEIVDPKPEPTPEMKSVDVYRLYNQWSGEHFYTANADEKDGLVKAGWTDENTAYTMDAAVGIPVYRLYNPWTGEHLFTTSENEYNTLDNIGWNGENIAFYSAQVGAPVYRLYNPWAPVSAQHLLTASENEYNSLRGLGWHDEGIAFYTY